MSTSSPAPTRKLAAILFADIVGYTKWVHADEAHALDRRRAVENLIKAAAAVQSGRVVKFMGDGAMLEFSSTVNAVSCAIEIQSQIASLNAGVDSERPLQMRIGIHVGDVVEEGQDLYGNGVNIASRVQSMAKPGGICITREVYSQIKPILKLECSKVSSLPEKDLPEPMDVFSVGGASSATDDRTPTRDLLRHCILMVIAFAGWFAFFRTWNLGVKANTISAWVFLGALVIAARTMFPDLNSRRNYRFPILEGIATFVVGSFVFYMMVGSIFAIMNDVIWENYVRYESPSSFYQELKTSPEKVGRLLPSLAASGGLEIQAPYVSAGIFPKNMIGVFPGQVGGIGKKTIMVGSFLYLVMILACIFGLRQTRRNLLKLALIVTMILSSSFFALGLSGGFPADLHTIANPTPNVEYTIHAPSKVAYNLVHQWINEQDLGVDERAIYPVVIASSRKKIAELSIFEIRETDAYRRLRRTAEGLKMVIPPYQVRLLSTGTESHIQLDFGNQPDGKIPVALAAAIPSLEKRLKLYLKAN